MHNKLKQVCERFQLLYTFIGISHILTEGIYFKQMFIIVTESIKILFGKIIESCWNTISVISKRKWLLVSRHLKEMSWRSCTKQSSNVPLRIRSTYRGNGPRATKWWREEKATGVWKAGTMNNAGMLHAFIQDPGFEMSGDNARGEGREKPQQAGGRHWEWCDTDDGGEEMWRIPC